MTNSPLLDAALDYAERGWPVFPCRPGRKNPLTEHGFKDATTDPGQIQAWWTARPDCNVAIATGAPGPDVIDFDVQADADYSALSELTTAGLLDGHGDMVRTRSGGLHLYFQGSGQPNGSIRSRHVDFRGRGGYVIAPPSFVEADDKPAGVYEIIGGQKDAQAELDWRIIRDFLEPPPPFQQPSAEKAALSTDRAGDDYAAHTSWPDILTPHGWRQVRQVGQVRYWCRPGKTGRFISASTRDDGGLWIFTTSTEFDPETLYSKFGAYTVLNGHGKDYRAAAAALRIAGYGSQPITLATVQQPAPSQPGGQEQAEAPEHTSWHPRDLDPILAGDETADPKPELLQRDDGQFLIYRAKINALIGESESGKTWIALAAVAQALNTGEQVLYLDFEDAPAGITGRLRALGSTTEQLAKLFRYVAPDEPLHVRAAAELAAALAEPVPDLIVVDGVNAAMTMLGLNLKDNKDATEFSQRVLRPLKRSGAAVLTVDHVGKDRETRGNYAIGAQAKRADIDGAAFLVHVDKPFGRGLQGKLRLTVSKDRPGHVRAISAHAKNAGTAILTSHQDGTVNVVISAPDTRLPEEKSAFRPTQLMERVSQFLEQLPDGAGITAIRAEVRGRNTYVDLAIERLIDEDFVSTEAAPRNKIIHKSLKPYREISERQIPTVSHPAPTMSDHVPDTVSVQPSDPVPTLSPTRTEGTGDGADTVALAAESPLEYGGCDNCGVKIIKYGPRAAGLCDDCKQPAP